MVAGNMVMEKSLGWVTDMGSGADTTTTRGEAEGITAEVAFAAVIAEVGCIMDMVSSCSGTS